MRESVVLYAYDVVVKEFTFAISFSDELLVVCGDRFDSLVKLR